MAEEEKIYDVVEVATNTGKIRRGVNEATKAIEREKAKVIVIAKDVSPEAIVMHLPVLCKEKKIPCVHVPSRKELGAASGLEVPVSALAILEEGDAKKTIENLKKTKVIEDTGAENKEEPKEAPKKEEKKETPKKEEVKEAPKKEEPKKETPKKEETPKETPKKEEAPKKEVKETPKEEKKEAPKEEAPKKEEAPAKEEKKE